MVLLEYSFSVYPLEGMSGVILQFVPYMTLIGGLWKAKLPRITQKDNDEDLKKVE